MTHVGWPRPLSWALLSPLLGYLCLPGVLQSSRNLWEGQVALRKWEEQVEERLNLGCRRQRLMGGCFGGFSPGKSLLQPVQSF